MNRKRCIIALSALITLVVVFILSYTLSGYFFKLNDKAPQREQVASGNINTISQEDKIAIEDENGMKEYTIDEFKSAFKYTGNLSRPEIIKFLENIGYDFVGKNDDEKDYNFIKKGVTKYEPNKYYIGEKGDSFAIYKADDDGKLFIESEDRDIFKDEPKVSSFSAYDQEIIKGFKRVYDSREEAYNYLTQYFS